MRTSAPLAALAVLLAGTVPASATTFAEAQEVAAREGKPILVDFFAVW